MSAEQAPRLKSIDKIEQLRDGTEINSHAEAESQSSPPENPNCNFEQEPQYDPVDPEDVSGE